MLLVNKEIISDDKLRKGKVLVSFIKDDYESVYDRVIEPLEKSGYKLSIVEKDSNNCLELFYHENVKRIIDDIACSVFVFSPTYKKEEYFNCLQTSFYEIGVIESKGIKVFPFILKSPEDDMKYFMNDKPIAQVQGANNIESLIKSVEKLNIPTEVYFNKREVDKYLIRHIKRVRLTVILDIYKKTLREIWESDDWDRDETKGENEYMKEMMDELFKELKTGATVIRFGKDEILSQPAFLPYVEEGKELLFNSPAQYDQTVKPKAVEKSEDSFTDKGDRDIATTIRMEFSIPVHDILGASFKPFLALSRRSKWGINNLMKIIEHDNELYKTFEKDSIKILRGKEESKIYFLLPMNVDKCVVDPGENNNEKFGRRCNFIFPK